MSAAPPPIRRPVGAPAKSDPQSHRTVRRITRILEEVVYNPGMTVGELAELLDAPKSSMYGFIRGLLADGWLYEERRRFYLGPAVYGLTLASGHIRAGLVTHADLVALHEDTEVAVFLGVQAGDHIINIGEAGNDPVAGFEARSNIRRSLIATAAGKVLLAARPDAQRESYLRRRGPEDADLVARFLEELEEIRATRIATNLRESGSRFAIATAVLNHSGGAVAAVTLVGPTAKLRPREEELRRLVLQHVKAWSRRAVTAREAI